MGRSGARLREVGTTNRTHLDDYRRALDAGVAAILTVHRSNFEQRGFVASPEPAALAALAAEAGIPYLYDVGSGLLADLAPWGLTAEPRVADALAAGADLVLFSGDKLLGGPQAGCLVGRRALLARCRENPLARAMRADKLTLAALEATLALYEDPETAVREIPVLAHAHARPGRPPVGRRAPRGRLPAGASRRRSSPASPRSAAARFRARSCPPRWWHSIPARSAPTAWRSGSGWASRRSSRGWPAGRVLLDPRTLPEEAAPRSAARSPRRCWRERRGRRVFLDRDGTIIEDVTISVIPDQVRLLPGAAEAIRRLNAAGMLAVVVTNQSGIARGLLTETDYDATVAGWTSCSPPRAPGSTPTTTVPTCPSSPARATAGSPARCSTSAPRASSISTWRPAGGWATACAISRAADRFGGRALLVLTGAGTAPTRARPGPMRSRSRPGAGLLAAAVDPNSGSRGSDQRR